MFSHQNFPPPLSLPFHPKSELEESIALLERMMRSPKLALSGIVAGAIALRKQHRLKLPDAIISATVLSLNALLLTNDLKLSSITTIQTQSLSTQ
jgi:predicted nucleic acid-binding protein